MTLGALGVCLAPTAARPPLGCVFLSVFVDWTDLYKESLVVMNLLAALAMCLLWVNLKPGRGPPSPSPTCIPPRI